jgi:hypothetical protein
MADLIARAERHSLTPTAQLVEDTACIVSGTIKLKRTIVPNFYFWLHEDFVGRWTTAGCYEDSGIAGLLVRPIIHGR